jgi:Na+-translocating ferredoxin:NAD+ oxidoreductase RnfA subunit
MQWRYAERTKVAKHGDLLSRKAALVQMVEMFLKKTSPSVYQALGIYLPLITTNCAVLGVALTNVQDEYNFAQSFDV